MQTGERTANKVAQKWEECPGRRVRLGAPRCAYAPKISAGKRVPLFRSRMGRVFRQPPNRKACPAISRNSGSCFPNSPEAESVSRSGSKCRDAFSTEAYIKEKGPLCRGPSQFEVAGKGIAPALPRVRTAAALPRLASCAGKRYRVSSAPRPHGVRFRAGAT